MLFKKNASLFSTAPSQSLPEHQTPLKESTTFFDDGGMNNQTYGLHFLKLRRA